MHQRVTKQFWRFRIIDRLTLCRSQAITLAPLRTCKKHQVTAGPKYKLKGLCNKFKSGAAINRVEMY